MRKTVVVCDFCFTLAETEDGPIMSSNASRVRDETRKLGWKLRRGSNGDVCPACIEQGKNK